MMAKNVGILASMSWNSNDWAGQATEEDILKSNFDYVKENGWMHEDLNFGFETYPLDEKGKFIAYTPQFNNLPSTEMSKDVAIIFLKSYNYKNGKNYIVGCYAYPEIGNFLRNPDEPLYKMYDFGNIRSTPENIIKFNNGIVINDEICAVNGYLPKGKKVGKQGFNYLEYNNVLKILDRAVIQSPGKKLDTIRFKILKDGGLKY